MAMVSGWFCRIASYNAYFASILGRGVLFLIYTRRKHSRKNIVQDTRPYPTDVMISIFLVLQENGERVGSVVECYT